MAHTPTPWRVQLVRGSYQRPALVMAGEKIVAECKGDQLEPRGTSIGEAHDNARLIVTAVNGFEAMREALKRALPYVELAYGEEGGEEAAEAKRDLDFCRAALAKVTP